MQLFVIFLLAVAIGTKEFRPLNRQILMQSIGHESAKKKFKKAILTVKEDCKGQVYITEPLPVFPLLGYDTNCISKTASNDYRDKGYDYFNGNVHLGHPGVDLQINDNDKDGLDDQTKKPVKIISMTEGIVLDVEEKWKPGGTIRDGNFILIYDFYNDQLVYYAHCGKILVDVGDILTAGTPIGFVGRTGTNASNQTSPTHLHLMILKLTKENLPYPENPVGFLKKIKRPD